MPNYSAPSVVGDGSSKITIIAEKVTGSHVLKVKGYSITKGQLGVGNRIDSGVFSIDGHRWILQYYPDGDNEESADYISVFVFVDIADYISMKAAGICLSLLNHAGEPVYTLTGKTHVLSSTRTTFVSWGCSKFIKRKELESSCLRDDSFQIKCDITVFKDLRTEPTSLTAPSAPALPPRPLDLPRHLGSLLESKVGGDVKFNVDGELFTAHRCVLAARSSVFMAELFGPMEAKAGHVHVVEDMEARVFRCLLHFIYTDSLPEIDVGDRAVMAQHLLVAADRYDLQRLKLICEDTLRCSVDISIAATTLVLAEQHACQGLKAACFEFLKAPGNLKAVLETDGFQHLKNSSPSLLVELLAQVAP